MLSKYQCRWNGCEKGFNFSSADQLSEHIDQVHVGHRRSEYFCDWDSCDRREKAFKKRYKLNLHLRVHTGDKPHPCRFPGCERIFSRTDALKVHWETHREKPTYPCPINGCERSYFQRGGLKKHINWHVEHGECRKEIFSDGKNQQLYNEIYDGNEMYESSFNNCANDLNNYANFNNCANFNNYANDLNDCSNNCSNNFNINSDSTFTSLNNNAISSFIKDPQFTSSNGDNNNPSISLSSLSQTFYAFPSSLFKTSNPDFSDALSSASAAKKKGCECSSCIAAIKRIFQSFNTN